MTRESVVITGANRGIGAALVRTFARGGWEVHAVARDSAAVNLSDLTDEERSSVRVFQCDLRNWHEIDGLSQSLGDSIDVLVNNAATFAPRAYNVTNFDPAEMLDAFAVNVVGPTLLAQKLHDRLLRSKRKLILMISTGNASLEANIEGEMMAYRASKTALNQVVRTMAAEWREQGLTTVALNPGWVRTRMGGENAPTSPEEAADHIFRFTLEANPDDNGSFSNTNRHPLPW